MLNDENKKLCCELLAKFGVEAQCIIAIEECSELQKAICKILRYDDASYDENLREEIADVLAMCQQLMLIIKMDMNEANSRIHSKFIRALKR